MNLEKLCLDIATTEDGDQVKNILENYSIWNNDDFWMNVGSIDEDDEELNNAAIIGAQQSNSANALVEKLVNCGDSALLLRCQEVGIDLQGNNSPLEKKVQIRILRIPLSIIVRDKILWILKKRLCL